MTGRADVLEVVVIYGRRLPVAECASCEQARPILGRGLCNACRWRHRDDGTIAEFGYVKADRVADYARFRLGGLGLAQAAARVGVSKRTGERYEAELAASGEAPWRREQRGEAARAA